MTRILIFAEAVTLAHVGRPIALSRTLRAKGYEVCIAAAASASKWLVDEPVATLNIESISSASFQSALAHGVPPYTLTTLKRYVQDDLRAIATWSPDIVIGDFRLSLHISSRLAGKAYGAIANAYWSRRYWPGAVAPGVAPLTWFSRSIADGIFRMVYPVPFALHALPFHRACRHFGVRSPGFDLRDVYTASDVVGFADVEVLYGDPGSGCEVAVSEDRPHFLGPLAWTPAAARPLPEIAPGLPIVFVSLGSSGAAHALPVILGVLAQMPLRVIVASAGSALPNPLPGNCIYTGDWLPYDAACSVASVSICSGGAPATYAALAAGIPIIGIASNLDQALNLHALQKILPECVFEVTPGQFPDLANTVTAAISRTSAGECTEIATAVARSSSDVNGVERWISRLRAGTSATRIGPASR